MSELELVSLEVVLIDCQATGSSWPGAQLIDVAWAVGSAAQGFELEQTLVGLPAGGRVPGRIAQLTGITTAMLSDAPSPQEVQARLSAQIKPARPFVAHYARFERPFIEALVERELPWICTHEIAARLLPGLPRKGLRPLAGYFGKLPEQVKRAADHVTATALVWEELVALLEAEEQVRTWDELSQWLMQTKAVRGGERALPLAREVRLALPDEPGVYRMCTRHGQVLYVGKATSLKQRVNSYFRGRRKIAEKVLELITQVWSLDVTVTGSALEAALLESDEIKRLSPPYNKQLMAGSHRVRFASWEDLGDLVEVPDAAHTLGPLMSTVSVERVGALMRALKGQQPPLMPGEVFYELGDEPVLWEGVALFEAEQGSSLKTLDGRGWLELGQRLRLEELDALVARLAQRALEASDDEDLEEVQEVDDEDEDDLEVLEWSPQLVCAALRQLAIRFYKRCMRAELMRAWLDIELTWRPMHAPALEPRQLILERGQRVERWSERVGVYDDPLEALSCFELETADRMSVLLAELRRIWRTSDVVRLRLPDGAELGADELGVIFTLI